MGDELFTIPNMLSILRLLLIPLIVYLYCFKHDSALTLAAVVFSAVTDVVDGFIARRFNMITDFGKFLDPLADKATQIVVLICLVTEFHTMIIPCIILFIKEIFSLVVRVVVYGKTDRVEGAKWHGKVATSLVIAMILCHLIWPDISPMMSYTLVGICSSFLVFSGTLYNLESIRMMKAGRINE